MTNHVDALVNSMQKTQEWIRDVALELGQESKQHAYSALRATLHTLRDRLTLEQNAHFSAQLPLVLRGTYFEGWKPQQVPQRIRTPDEFLEAMRLHMVDATPEAREHCEQAARAALCVIGQHVDPAIMQKIRDSFPKGLRELWPGRA
jgi:uncharacterized protein (DUF2267 family)